MKDKILSAFSQINVPMLVFLALATRIVIYGSGWGEALAMFSIAGLYGYTKYLTRKDIIWMQTVEKEITQLKNAVSSVKMKQSAKSMYGEKDDNESREKSIPKRYF